MDLVHIHKFFWYSISVSLLIVAGIFSFTAYNAKGMAIEIANGKVAISSKLSDIDKINNQLLIQA